MDAFSGFEPQVGEIRALRTFRVDEHGRLLPLYSRLAWTDGVNTAVCARIGGPPEDLADHTAPDPECRCGFYAYGSERAVEQHRNARYVSAVVSCWGRVIAGSRGIRAQYARIEALCVASSAPSEVRRGLARRYPSVAIYPDRATMLDEHPLSALECYRETWLARIWPGGTNPVLANVLQTVILAVGLIPATTLRGNAMLWAMWSVATAFVALMTVFLLSGVGGRLPRTAALGPVILMLWLIAPISGTAGWLLRVPTLMLVVVGLGSYLVTRRRGYFPVVPAIAIDTPPRRVVPKTRPRASAGSPVRQLRPGTGPRLHRSRRSGPARAKNRKSRP